MQTNLFEKPTKTNLIKNMLVNAGTVGVSNFALNKVAFRYGSIIHRLRQDGYIIETVAVKPSTGYFKFYYRGRQHAGN